MRTAKDLSNEIFNRWTVKSFAGKRGKVPYWHCTCECGTKQEVCQWSLTSNKSTSCGCYHRELLFGDLTGLTFGRWKVKRYAGKHENGTHSVYLCKCKCGNQKIVMAQSLNQGLSQSCGCLHKETVQLKLTKQTFGRLTAIKVVSTDKSGHRRWLCECVCGKMKTVSGKHLIAGNVTSCGCKVRTQNGKSRTKKMRAYYAKKRRERKMLLDVLWTPEMDTLLRELQPACVLCTSTSNLTVDHVRPLSLGFGLEPGNAVTLCGSCNSTKINKHPNQLPKAMSVRLLKAAKDFELAWNAA